MITASHRRLAGVLGCVAGLCGSGALADQLPLWEAGIGLGMVDFPDYRGSDERTNLLLPIPYFVYRGEVFKIDREGIRGLFLKNDAIELDLSGNASVPVDSSENQARQGMPDLDGTVEVGPTLDITLARAQDGRASLKLELPVRAVIATDFSHAKGAGFVFQPKLDLDLHHLTTLHGWRAGMSVGPMFGDRRYHAYYYNVDPAFATPQRPAYSARAGYGGTQLTLSTSRRFPRFWVGAFARYEWLEGAVFDNSPLVRQDRAFSAGIAFAWILGRSSTLVDADD